MNETGELSSRVSVAFHSSSQKGGVEAYTVRVDEGADEAEAERVMALAIRMRLAAVTTLEPASLEGQLEQSIAKVPPKEVRDATVNRIVAEIDNAAAAR